MYAIFIHAHQKIDRIAHAHLRRLDDSHEFPSIRNILHFEGKRGPDATKLKRATDCEQPWHFIDPNHIENAELNGHIRDHYDELVAALRADDAVRASFESAWLAHALVDGLTPAHHFPYERELEELRGDSRHSRKGLIGRAYVKGDTASESIRRSLRLIGPKGILTTHTVFEAGVYMTMMPARSRRAAPTDIQLQMALNKGIVYYFQQTVRDVAQHNLFVRFTESGWTSPLVRDIKKELIPRMINIVTVAWYAALVDAGKVKR